MIALLIIIALVAFLIFGADKVNVSKTQVTAWVGLLTSILAPFTQAVGVDLPQAELVAFIDQLYASAEVIGSELEKLSVMAVSVATGISSAVMLFFRMISSTAAGLLGRK